MHSDFSNALRRFSVLRHTQEKAACCATQQPSRAQPQRARHHAAHDARPLHERDAVQLDVLQVHAVQRGIVVHRHLAAWGARQAGTIEAGAHHQGAAGLHRWALKPVPSCNGLQLSACPTQLLTRLAISYTAAAQHETWTVNPHQGPPTRCAPPPPLRTSRTS